MANQPKLQMNNNISIPQIGLGVFQIPADETEAPVLTALEAGYRSIDTAQGYGNEEGVGTAIKKSGIRREEIFVTTKLTNAMQGAENTMRAFDESMEKLQLDTLDLFLIHWPQPMFDQYVDTWKAFQKLHAEGRVKSIGVSNFNPDHLQRLFDETEIVPAVNQIELHPRLPQQELRNFHAKHNILTEAWSPIGQGKGLLDEPMLAEIGKQYSKSAAQVVLRWHMQLGNIAIPKSVTPSRIKENFEVFDFELTSDDMTRIASLETGERVGPDPETFDAR